MTPFFLRSAAKSQIKLPTIPPARAFACDQAFHAMAFQREFEVVAFDAYDVILGFGDVNASDESGLLREYKDRDPRWRRLLGEFRDGRWTGNLSAFIGGSARKFVRRDTGETLRGSAPNDVALRDEMLRRGELLTKPAEPGVEIPVTLMVERMNASGESAIVHNSKIITSGDDGNRLGFKQRFLIRGLKLQPGRYRLTLNVLSQIEVPDGVGVYIVIPLRDWKSSRANP